LEPKGSLQNTKTKKILTTDKTNHGIERLVNVIYVFFSQAAE